MIGNKPVYIGGNTNSNELKYIANLTQTTVEPIATILRNDFGANIIWKKDAPNKFSATLESGFKFMKNRTTLFINKPTADTKIYRKNTQTIIIECPENTLNETSIEISVIELNGLFSNEFNQLFN